MDKVRRLFLKVLGLTPVIVAVPRVSETTQTEPDMALDIPDLKFHAYLSPEIIGWKGYWYKEHNATHIRDWNQTRVTHEIVAFESLDGKRLVSPWALGTDAEIYYKARAKAVSSVREFKKRRG